MPDIRARYRTGGDDKGGVLGCAASDRSPARDSAMRCSRLAAADANGLMWTYLP